MRLLFIILTSLLLPLGKAMAWEKTKLESVASQQHLGKRYAVVVVSEQKLYFMDHGRLSTYAVSTSAYGIGSEAGSNQTPLGLHKVAKRFGDDQPKGMIFKARQPTGQLAEIITEPVDIESDDVTTRILWLEGQEPGRNRGKNRHGVSVDSFQRYIYIHGTPEEGLIGRPASHGCVRMYNDDVIRLYARMPVGTPVYIVAE